MSPLPGIMAMLTPSQPAFKSLTANVTASSATVTTASITTTAQTVTDHAVDKVTGASIEPIKSSENNNVPLTTAVASLPSEDPIQNPVTDSSQKMADTSVANIVNTDNTNPVNTECSNSSSSSSNNGNTEIYDNTSNCDNKNNEMSENADNNNLTETDSDLSTNIFGRPQKILLENVNDNITCGICRGYLIDATTIVECLHSFCHSCIMNYLRKDQYCPRCEMMINTTKHNNIKLDTTLQAIVYKLVPGLYEKELLRKRAFYSTRPEEAKLAAPEQRGEDTEYLIFGPTDNMSLSLEYADIEELPENDSLELRSPKFLQCPANFTVGHLKKFVFGKFGIDQARFIIDIMYKVKTILLADHYKMMDVAYIYTWKRDAPMKFFFRVKEVERPIRRRQISRTPRTNVDVSAGSHKDTALNENSNEIKQEDDEVKIEIDEKPETDIKCESEAAKQGNSPLLELQNPIEIEVKQEGENEFNLEKSTSDKSPTLTQLANKMSQDVLLLQRANAEKLMQRFEKSSLSITNQRTSDKSITEQKTDKLRITLVNKVKKDEDTPKSKSNSKANKTPKHSPPLEPGDRKVENIKLKIDLSKEGSVTIINMSSPDSTKKEIVKPLKSEKEWKIKVKKDKDHRTNGTNDAAKSPTGDRIVPPITIEKADSSHSSEKSQDEQDEEIKKSEFLNSIHLTPIKSMNSPERQEKQKISSKATLSQPKAPLIPTFTIKKPSMPPPPAPDAMKLSAASKRKSKEPIKTISKKPCLDLPLPKTMPPPSLPLVNPLKVRSDLVETKSDSPGISFKLAPFPIGATAKNSSKDLKSAADNASGELAEKKLEDEKLMPAPPPLKMLDIFKRNGVKGVVKSTKPKFPTKTNTKTANSSDGFLRPMITTNMTNSKVPIISNVMGNRTPVARRYPPILPKSPRTNPFANLPGDVSNLLQNNVTEIKPIQNGDSKEIKVYGPLSAITSSPSNQKPTVSIATSMPSLHPNTAIATATAANQRPLQKPSTSSNYLNYALFNSSKSKMSEVGIGCRTPIYTPNSPIYSPNSPQYMPNYNIPIQPTYKYTKSQSNANNILQNILGTNKQMSNLFPAPPTKKPEHSVNNNNNNNKTESSEAASRLSRTPPAVGKKSPEPGDKRTPVQSLLNSCNINIPSSLSITITNEIDDVSISKSMNPKHSNPVNNYIEIVKLPETPAVDQPKNTTPPPQTSDSKTSPISSPVTMKPKTPTPPLKISPPSVTKPNALLPKSKSDPQLVSEKKTPPPLASTKPTKKTPSPDKKSNEKQIKKPGEKRSASDSAKSAKDKSDISPIALKKYRPILPRSKTPPPNPSNLTATSLLNLTAKLPPKLPTKQVGTNLKFQTMKKSSPKTANSGNKTASNARKTELDSITPRKSITPPSTMPVLSAPATVQPTTGITPDLAAFLTQQQQQLQQQQQGNQSPCNSITNGANFLPHFAAAAAFNPAVSFDIQRAFFMEHLARMQKAGAEALEKYMQQLKNNNTSCAKSPAGSPGSNGSSSPSVPTSPVNNVKNSV